jgi:hypothetical protein
MTTQRTATSKTTPARLYAVALSDAASDSDRRLVWALPRGKFRPSRYSPAVWDLDAETTDAKARRFTWADAVDSITRWLGTFQPPIKIEHGAIDGLAKPSDDALLNEVATYGLVTGAREVDEATARAMGIEQDGDALHFEIAPVAEVARMMRDKQLPYTSPALLCGFIDDEGTEWPLIVRELSFTASPRLTTRQPPNASAQLSERHHSAFDAITLSESDEMDEIEVKAPEGDALAALTAAVAELAERLAAVESRLPELADPAVDETKAEEMEATLSDPTELQRAMKRIVSGKRGV